MFLALNQNKFQKREFPEYLLDQKYAANALKRVFKTQFWNLFLSWKRNIAILQNTKSLKI